MFGYELALLTAFPRCTVSYNRGSWQLPPVLILLQLLISLKQAVSCWSVVPVASGWLQFAADPITKDYHFSLFHLYINYKPLSPFKCIFIKILLDKLWWKVLKKYKTLKNLGLCSSLPSKRIILSLTASMWNTM